MIRAVQLSGSKECGSHGWSRVKEPGWDKVCGDAYKAIQQSPVPISDLRANIEEIRAKTRDIITVQHAFHKIFCVYEEYSKTDIISPIKSKTHRILRGFYGSARKSMTNYVSVRKFQ
jgi:hypothetical protein